MKYNTPSSLVWVLGYFYIKPPALSQTSPTTNIFRTKNKAFIDETKVYHTNHFNPVPVTLFFPSSHLRLYLVF